MTRLFLQSAYSIVQYFTPKSNSGSGLQWGNWSGDAQLSLFTLAVINCCTFLFFLLGKLIICLQDLPLLLLQRKWKSHLSSFVACTSLIYTYILFIFLLTTNTIINFLLLTAIFKLYETKCILVSVSLPPSHVFVSVSDSSVPDICVVLCKKT